MSEAKHTPGPWIISGPDPFGDYTINSSSDPLAIASVCNGEMWRMGGLQAEHAASAHLIAAAPEMYEALVECEKAFEIDAKTEVVDGETYSNPQAMRLMQVRAALAKARGE